MKNKVKWIIYVLSLTAVIVVAVVLYNTLSDKYKPQNIEKTTQENKNDTAQINPAPDFTVTDYEGNPVKLSDFKGKPVVLNFWATWCYYCKVEMPDFDTAAKKYPDIQFMMVNATDGVSETVSVAKEYIEKEKFEFDVFFDTGRNAVTTYKLTGYPATFFIDKDGNLVAKGSGMLDMASLERGIEMINE